MKASLLFILVLFGSFMARAQVWAPTGATWHYDWVQFATDGYAKITSIGDSTVGGKECKVLKVEVHKYDWINNIYSNYVLGYEYTYLENNVVYYYRFGQFYTLYDFNSVPGNSWIIAGENIGLPCDSTGTTVVDSTGETTINSFSLKYLYVSPGQNSDWAFYYKILERIGCLGYMFPGQQCVLDVPGPGMLRCYYDDEFGLYQRTGFPPACDYITDINNNLNSSNDIKIYPIPTSSVLTVEMTNRANDLYVIEISNVLGSRLKRMETHAEKVVINVEDLREGIYCITITNQDGFVWSQKFIKNVP